MSNLYKIIGCVYPFLCKFGHNNYDCLAIIDFLFPVILAKFDRLKAKQHNVIQVKLAQFHFFTVHYIVCFVDYIRCYYIGIQ
jgi:hypothetical protein